eukprot:jgi/Botrbrau1/19938/Bobra.0059s0055.1
MLQSTAFAAHNVGSLVALRSRPRLSGHIITRRLAHTPRRATVRATAGQDEDVGPVGLAAVAGGLVANPVVLWSLYTLKTTGSGLPPGPGGALGALEGVSYLVVTALVGWSVYTKLQTGKGLPPGPAGLLGAVEGFSFLSLLGIVVIFGLEYVKAIIE